MRFGKMSHVAAGVAGFALLAGMTAGCGPTQAEKDLNAKMESAAGRTEAAASKAEMAANKADAAAKAAADAAAKAQAAADKAEAIFHKHMRK
jgi:uncharacterized protein DUF3359